MNDNYGLWVRTLVQSYAIKWNITMQIDFVMIA